MKVGKPKSKRVPVRLRHKIEKSSAAKQRKQRKEAKKNPQWRSRLKKDPGIPNLFPYKAKVLAEIEEGRRRKEEHSLRRREVAKAQRLGMSVEEVRHEGVAAVAPAGGEEEDDDELLDDVEEDEEDEEMDVQDDSSNPMAALLASAQARAQTYTKDGEGGDLADNVDSAEEEEDEWDGITENTTTTTPAARQSLPRQALADPIKAVSALVARMHSTTDGIERLIAHYHVPPLASSTASDFHTRFLVEVARKRGRLGRGGVPNLHSAALAVLADVHEGRLELPVATKMVEGRKSGNGPMGKKGEVQIVTQLAEPFRLEGLWGDGARQEQEDTGGQADMVVEL